MTKRTSLFNVFHVMLLVWLSLVRPNFIMAQQGDTLSTSHFVQGCARYREQVISEIIETFVHFNMLCDSLKQVSKYPEKHEEFRKALIQSILNQEILPLESLISKTLPPELLGDHKSYKLYRQWAQTYRVQIYQFSFLAIEGVLMPKSPYPLGDIRDFYKEIKAYDLRAGQTFVDVGAGTGIITYILSLSGFPLQLYLTELDGMFLDFHFREATLKSNDRTGQKVNVVIALPHGLGLEAQVKADRILMREVYHHLNAPKEVLASVREHLAPGGMLILVETTSDTKLPDHVACNRAMSYEQIIREVTKAGFRLVSQDKIRDSFVIRFTL